MPTRRVVKGVRSPDLPITWQRLVSGGKTCDRCAATHTEVVEAHCRTVEVRGITFETIPEPLIIKGGLRAAGDRLDTDA